MRVLFYLVELGSISCLKQNFSNNLITTFTLKWRLSQLGWHANPFLRSLSSSCLPETVSKIHGQWSNGIWSQPEEFSYRALHCCIPVTIVAYLLPRIKLCRLWLREKHVCSLYMKSWDLFDKLKLKYSQISILDIRLED